MHRANLLFLPGGERWILLFGHLQLRRLIFSLGLLTEPLVASSMSSTARVGSILVCSHWLGAGVFISASQTQPSDWGCGEVQAADHEHKHLKCTRLSWRLLLLFISRPFLWLWSSDLWQGWSRLPRNALWGNGSRAKVTLPARSRRVRIPLSWC